MYRLRACIFLLAVACGAALAQAAEDGPRFALVIGNSAYAHAGRLNNPVNDAKLIASSLSAQRFDVVVVEDVGLEGLKNAVRELAARLRTGGPTSVGVMYYAGHGIQLQDENFLVPVDADIQAPSDAFFEAVGLSDVLQSLGEAGNRINLVILDACRNNPFASESRAMSRGLAVVQAPPGTLVAYATAPGHVALDGAGTPNSPYAEALARNMDGAHASIELMFKRVRVDVFRVTGGQQTPWESTSLFDEFRFDNEQKAVSQQGSEAGATSAAGPSSSATVEEPAEIVEQPTIAVADKCRDVEFYKALSANSIESYQAFIDTCPASPQVAQVQAIMRNLSDETTWHDAVSSGTLDAFTRYLLAFGQSGTHAEEARRRLELLSTPEPSCDGGGGDYSVVGVKAGDVLNVRAVPNPKGALRFTIPPDTPGVAINRCASDGTWCLITFKCQQGWVNRRYLATTLQSSQSAGGSGGYRVVGVASNDVLNARRGPGTRHPIVFAVPYSAIDIEILSCRGGDSQSSVTWCQISYGGGVGWVNRKYLARQ